MDRGHAEALFPMIEAVLAAAGASYSDLSKVGICTGPGSFTGIRAGVAAARGLALGLNIPAISVNRVEALSVGHGRSIAVRLRGDSIVFAEADDLTNPRLGTIADLPPGLLLLEGDDARPDPVIIARVAANRAASSRPAPAYLRPADAAPSSDLPPRMLD